MRSFPPCFALGGAFTLYAFVHFLRWAALCAENEDEDEEEKETALEALFSKVKNKLRS